MGDEGKGSNTKKLTRRGTSHGRGLQEIFHFFRWNAEFQKQRKEYLVSLLKPKKESLVQQFARKYSSLTGKK